MLLTCFYEKIPLTADGMASKQYCLGFTSAPDRAVIEHWLNFQVWYATITIIVFFQIVVLNFPSDWNPKLLTHRVCSLQ
jgi:hypothetical protein